MIERRIQRSLKWRKRAAQTHVNFVLSPGKTQAAVIREIAKLLGCSVGILPEQLVSFPLGRTVFGYADKILDDIAAEHDSDWFVEDDVLSFGRRSKLPTLGDLLSKHLPSGTVKLDAREKRIWRVIELGLEGEKHWREMDNAGIGTRRNGCWKECPRSYLAAYRLGKPWRHRIEDEKTRIRRKAELAGLANRVDHKIPIKPA